MPRIKQEFIDQLLFETDIVSVFQHNGIDLKKKGAHYWCNSPFKDEKTPSCQVKQTTQKFHDYSSQTSGDAISFLMQTKNLTYPEAIEELAKMQGKTVEYETSEFTEQHKEKRAEKENLQKAIKAVNKKLREELYKLPKSHAAWKEIEKRGYTDEEVKEYELGFAPGNQFIYRLFSEIGAVEDARTLDLITDKNQDKFFNVLVYPLFDDQNNVSGFARRRLDENSDYPKWQNPTNTPIFQKDKFLYGLNFAKSAIIKSKRVWVVEGYNDVIAWQKNGITNTVGCNGTALTTSQITILGKLTKKVVLCLDGDAAGKTATVRSIPLLLAAGFHVDVCQLPTGLDPDEYSRNFVATPEVPDFEKSLQSLTISGFEVLMLEKLSGDVQDRSNGLKDLLKIVSQIPDIITQTHYHEVLRKETKQNATVIKKLAQELEAEKVKITNSETLKYFLPKEVKTELSVLEPIIEAYQLFISDNQIWMQEFSEVGADSFKSVSNFSIEILQHMNDEKFPMKLLRICNTKNEERIFDARADALVSPQDFKKLCANQGNYQWNGNQKELDKLTAYLYDKMGVGRKIDVLGWNPEGFYCWNNFVTVPGNPNIEIDKNGIFHFDSHTYYVPSANEIYRANPNRYATQKKVMLKPGDVPMEKYLDKMVKVHREFGVIGILFAFASAHQDLIVETAKGFPIYFLYGPPSTGKDELFGCMKRMFGISKTNFTNLENKQSTGKAKLRNFGEFSNMMVHLSEYTNGDKEVDGMLKGLWDRGSYKRATLDSAVSTDSLSILCSAIVTGNQSPNDEAVLSRLIYGDMIKNQFTLEEKRNFEELETMTTDGITAYMQKVIWHRPLFEEKFAEKFNMYKKILSQRESFKGSIDRIITNYAILGATHEILKETHDIVFPFTGQQMLEVFDLFVGNLRRKLDSASIFNKFWDVFVACLYGTETSKLQLGVHVDVKGNDLYIRFTEVYNRIQTEWFPRFSESCPAKTTLMEKLKTDNCFIEEKKGHRFGSSVTSAYKLDLNKIENKESILSGLNMQLETLEKNQTGMDNIFNSPATPKNKGNEEENSGDLRF